ncbi:hypothetical protein [Nostoc sp.]
MRVIVTVVKKIVSEAHIDIPDGLNQSAGLRWCIILGFTLLN